MGLIHDLRLIRFYRSMSNSCEAGLSPLRSLEILSRDRATAPVTLDLLERLRAGRPLAEGLRAHPVFFPPWQAEIVAIGEATGRLDRAFRSVAELLEERRAFVLSLLPGLLYPLGLLHLAPLFLYAPRIVNEGYAAFLVSSLGFLAFFYVPAGLLYALWRGWLKESPIAGRLPLVSTLVKAQFCFYFSSLIRAAVPFERALEVAAAASGLGAGAAAAAAGTVGQDPGGVADRMRRLGLFSDQELGQIEAGELAGKVDAELARIAEQSKALWQAVLKSAAAVLPPLVYLLVALAVASRIIGFYRGYYATLDSLMH